MTCFGLDPRYIQHTLRNLAKVHVILFSFSYLFLYFGDGGRSIYHSPLILMKRKRSYARFHLFIQIYFYQLIQAKNLMELKRSGIKPEYVVFMSYGIQIRKDIEIHLGVKKKLCYFSWENIPRENQRVLRTGF